MNICEHYPFKNVFHKNTRYIFRNSSHSVYTSITFFLSKGYTCNLCPMSCIKFAACCRYDNSLSTSNPHFLLGVLASCSFVKYHFSSAAIYSRTKDVHTTFKKEVVNSGCDWLVGQEFLGSTNYVIRDEPSLFFLIHNIYFRLIIRRKIISVNGHIMNLSAHAFAKWTENAIFWVGFVQCIHGGE